MGHHEGFRRFPACLVWGLDGGGTPLGMKRHSLSRRILAASAVSVLSLGVVACDDDDDDDIEIDNPVDDVEEGVEDVEQDVEEGVDEVEEDVQDVEEEIETDTETDDGG